MFEEPIWAWMNSWFTPTVLFVLLNLTIATIAITSYKPHHHNQQALLERSPSVLQRLKSINLCSYRSQQPLTTDHETTAAVSFFRSPSLLQRLNSIGRHTAAAPEPEPEKIGDDDSGDDARSIDEIYSQLNGGAHGHVSRSKSDTKPTPGEAAPPRLAGKMRKSASSKSAFAHFEEAETVEARRPATVREARVPAEDDEEVDAKADDFINRFKQQLKLQRLDSIIRRGDDRQRRRQVKN